MPDMNRSQLADAVNQLGQDANQLRDTALANNYPYVAGLIRSVEETLLVALGMLRNAPERDL